ncbi:hypothetical protein B566_EDAN011311 [Ephemera danica]|nr:hypothetical protein B566_EDAN011311 [Ephemera danica]
MESVGDFEYNSKDLIGHGAFAVVFKGRRKKNPSFVVAIKSITKKNLAKSQNLLGKEIKILKELTELHHENVVALLDCKETPTNVYLVMEYCNGGDLADYLSAKGTLSEDTIRLFLRQLAGAMRALHAKGIVHRDLKPQNILLSHSIAGPKACPQPNEIRLKIADFGFARFLQDGVMAATLCGSPMYMAPEVIMSLQYDAKADLWSLGTIVFQCLTGKAPFQAQTPQALKTFYEKNANLAPKIPSGTSQELAELLMGLLRRNARDRMDFDHFFSHPFLKKGPNSSQHRHHSKGATPPVAVPQSKRSSGNACASAPLAHSPASQQATPTGSPIPGHLPPSPGALLYQETMKSPPEQQGAEGVCGSPVGSPMSARGSCSSGEEHDDFVLVPSHLPSTDNLSDSCSQAELPPNDLLDVSGKSPISKVRAGYLHASPPRPSYLPISEQTTSPAAAMLGKMGSEPIPVPSQRDAYQQIHGSYPVPPQLDNNNLEVTGATEQISPVRNSVPRSQPISMKRTSESQRTGTTDISSISPPSVQFTMGTPPGNGRRRSASGSSCGTPPPVTTWQVSPVTQCAVLGPTGRHGTPNSSPLRRSGVHCVSSAGVSSSPHLTGPLFGQGGPGMLPPILGSPTKLPGGHTGAMAFDNACCGQGSDRCGNLPVDWCARLHGNPLVPPFVTRTVTLPEITERAGMQRRPSFGLFPDPGDVFSSSPPQQTGGAAALEGPITFVAPELPEETLLEREHNETLAKLNFVLALADCVIELARSRTTPLSALTDSVACAAPPPQQATATASPPFQSTPGQATGSLDGLKRAEQLVLLVRALQLLSSGLNLATQELRASRLQPSTTVKNVVSMLNEKFHYCLSTCKQLNMPGLLQRAGVDPSTSSITADRILYNHAIEMVSCSSLATDQGLMSMCLQCQSAALDELFGNPQEQRCSGETLVCTAAARLHLCIRLNLMGAAGLAAGCGTSETSKSACTQPSLSKGQHSSPYH